MASSSCLGERGGDQLSRECNCFSYKDVRAIESPSKERNASIERLGEHIGVAMSLDCCSGPGKESLCWLDRCGDRVGDVLAREREASLDDWSGDSFGEAFFCKREVKSSFLMDLRGEADSCNF